MMGLLWACITIGAVVALYIREKTISYPLIHLKKFKDRPFLVYILLRSTGAFTTFSIMYLLAYVLQRFLLFEPLIAGMYFLPINLSVACFSVLSGYWHFLSPSSWMKLGHILLALSVTFIIIMLFFTYNFFSLFIPFVLLGFSYGLFLPANSLVALGRISDSHRGIASSILYMVVYFSGSLAVLIGSLLIHRLGPLFFMSMAPQDNISLSPQNQDKIYALFQGQYSVSEILKTMPQHAVSVFHLIEESALYILQLDLLLCAFLVMCSSLAAYWLLKNYSST